MKKIILLTIMMCLFLGINGLSQERVLIGSDSAIEKKLEELRDKSRLGMTQEELTLLWGKSLGKSTPWKNAIGHGNVGSPGIKREHQKYFGKDYTGLLYKIDDMEISVHFYKGRAVCMKFFRWNADFTNAQAAKVAEGICKAKFPVSKFKEGKGYSLYSIDRKQRYLFQRQNGSGFKNGSGLFSVIDVPVWIQMRTEEMKEKESTTVLDKL